jgi:hypothetical protein
MSRHKVDATIHALYAHALLPQAGLIMHASNGPFLAGADINGMIRIMQVILAPQALSLSSRTFWSQPCWMAVPVIGIAASIPWHVMGYSSDSMKAVPMVRCCAILVPANTFYNMLN